MSSSQSVEGGMALSGVNGYETFYDLARRPKLGTMTE